MKFSILLLILFSNLSFAQTHDINDKTEAYVQSKIERKIKPLAWESHDINETLELLYGKDRVYETSKDIHIKLSTNTEEYFDTSMGVGYIDIHTNKIVKSIAILHKKDRDRALTTLYYLYDNTANIRLPLKMLDAKLTMGKEGMKVVVITETEDNHLFINEYPIKYSYFCTYGGDAMYYYMNELRENLNTNVLKTKYKIDENGVGYFKFMINHPMVSYTEAKELKVKANFVSHIHGSIKDKKLFDLYISEYMGKDPLIKMEFQNMKQGENIDFSYSTINGEVTSKEVLARRSKKKDK